MRLKRVGLLLALAMVRPAGLVGAQSTTATIRGRWRFAGLALARRNESP